MLRHRMSKIGYPVIITGVAAMSVFGIAAASSGARDDLSTRDLKRVEAVTRPTDDFSKPEKFEAMQGGSGTRQDASGRSAFSYPAANMPESGRQDFSLGEALFSKLWVSAPASTKASDGLGPLFNARACSTCHVGNGRGNTDTLIYSLSGKGGMDPVYGRQLQPRAIQGHSAEGQVAIAYDQFEVRLNDGTMVSMRQPAYSVSDLAYGPLDEGTAISPRLAPPLHGLALIEQIAKGDLEAQADPDDRDEDGISGRLHLVADPASGKTVIGRYGWKAQQPSVRSQSAAAFAADLGLSTVLYPAHGGDCTAAQGHCSLAPHGAQPQSDGVEVPEAVLDLAAGFAGHIAVPARREVGDPEVLRGKELFYKSGCAACHRPKFVTRRNVDPGISDFQLIWPYSDFLLHDMGDGLADPGDGKLAREWRTPPLWGIGMTRSVLGSEYYLHDGRARTLEEAILWHGGEGATSRNVYTAMSVRDRDALIGFLKSL